MVKLAKIYFLWFYYFYVLFERSPSRWASAWKASVSLTVLEIWFMLSLAIHIIIGTKAEFPETVERFAIGVFGASVGILNYLMFLHNGRWKREAQKFDVVLGKSDVFGWMWFWLVNLLAATSLVFAFYRMSLVDWQG